MKRALGGLILATSFATAISLTPTEARAGGGTTETFTVDGRATDLFVPSAPQANAPLVLMLHGCSQSAQDFEAATRMNDLAEAQGFYVVWPTQPVSQNIEQCWNWFDPESQARGAGEPAQLVDVVNEAEKRHTIDVNHVYVAGFSSGGAMAAILGATYPDVFAAVSISSGLEYKAAGSAGGALAAQSAGGPDPTKQGDAIFAAMGKSARAVPTLVLHGTADNTVANVNGHQVVTSWSRANADALGLAALTAPTSVTSQVDAGRSYTTDTTLGPDKAPLVVGVWVTGMDHAWSGGAQGVSYTDPGGPDATGLSWSFFAAHPLTAPSGKVAPDAGTAGDAGGSGGSGGNGDGGALADGGSANDADSGEEILSGDPLGGGGSGCDVSRGERPWPLAWLLPLSALLAFRARRRR